MVEAVTHEGELALTIANGDEKTILLSASDSARLADHATARKLSPLLTEAYEAGRDLVNAIAAIRAGLPKDALDALPGIDRAELDAAIVRMRRAYGPRVQHLPQWPEHSSLPPLAAPPEPDHTAEEAREAAG